MIPNVGYFTLVMAFVVAVYAAAAAWYGSRKGKPTWVESARRAMVLTWPLTSISVLAMVILLVTGRYEIYYVASVTNSSMPTYLKITALWGGQSGSLLFWSWLMAAFASAAGLRRWDRDREFLPWVVIVTMVTMAFFLSLVVFLENPFARIWQAPTGEQVYSLFQPSGALLFVPYDGLGLNPLLRHPGMIIHPPMLYLGFVSFVIPYAFAIAALQTGRSDNRWIRITRRWTLVAWIFLTLGLILGGRWAYDVLGWGGYWGWDPVEISALMPWLAGTAFLHSVVVQEKRGMLKHWNMVLVILTYALVILGTFLTRSGVLSSVHAFAESAIGPMFFGFISIMSMASLSLLTKRWDSLKGEEQLRSLFSRESLFLINNLLFMGILVVCLWGVIFPLISELISGKKVTVGPPFYEQATGPLIAGLLLLMGIAPFSAYGRTSWRKLLRAIWIPLVLSLFVPVTLLIQGLLLWPALLGYWLAAFVALVTLMEFWRGTWARHKRHGESLLSALGRLMARNRRRYGGYLVHLGVVLLAVGVIGIEMFQTETQGTLARGEQITIERYVLIYEDLQQSMQTDARRVTRARLSVYRDGEWVGEVFPRQDYYFDSRQSMTIPGLRSTLRDDLYVILAGWESISLESATFKVYHNPLVNFMWMGGMVFILGTLVAIWPNRASSGSETRAPFRKDRTGLERQG
ncbi:MAG: heme lyase CcmF/NrfE family subunit [Anaerolineales bacterium]